MSVVKPIQTAKREPSHPEPAPQIRFIRKKEVMHRTGLPSSTIYDLMRRSLFPQSLKLAGGKAIAWLESDVEAWLQQCLEQSQGVA
jgi:prophage regulatory protein